MFVRPAFRADLHDCFVLDSSYETNCVWQLDQREDEAGIATALRRVRLPRPMAVRYPPLGWDLLNRWEQGGGIFVAEVDGQARGCVDVGVHGDEKLGWVYNLVVDRAYRRRGLGTALLEAAVRWGQHRSVRRMMLAVQSKNHPSVQFCQKLGFGFCGFNDRYFANRDIALFFVGSVP